MIIYGTRATLLKSELIFEPCPNCQTTNSVQIGVYQRYAHVFWIPFFPIGKTGVSACGHCQQVLKSGQMPPALKLVYDNVKARTRIPVWHFSGLFLVALIVIAVIISDQKRGEKVGKYILAPKVNDVYEVKEKDEKYTLYKVQRIAGDTVFFVVNKYQTNQETGLDDLKSKEYDMTVQYGLVRSKLQEMNSKDEIIDIDRN